MIEKSASLTYEPSSEPPPHTPHLRLSTSEFGHVTLMTSKFMDHVKNDGGVRGSECKVQCAGTPLSAPVGGVWGAGIRVQGVCFWVKGFEVAENV